MQVSDSAGLPAGQAELVLTVSHELQLESATLAFSEGEVQEAINETLAYPQSLAAQRWPWSRIATCQAYYQAANDA